MTAFNGFVVTLLAAGAVPAVFAFDVTSEFDLTLRGDYYRSSKRLDDDTGFPGWTIQGKYHSSFGEYLRTKLDVRVLDPDVERGGNTDATVIEAYADIDTGAGKFRLGRQIVAWGRADAINPTDNLSPRDYTVLLPFDEDERKGVTAIKYDRYLSSEHTVSIFLTPYFEPSIIPRPPRVGAVLRERRPAHSTSNTALALKLDKTGGAVDWSISYFDGYNLIPAGRLVSESGATATELYYPKIRTVGADMARSFGRYGIRGEAAYTMTEREFGAQPLKPYLHYVLGVDRTFLENLNINVQGWGRHVRDYRDPASAPDPDERTLAAANALTLNQGRTVSYGLTLRVSDKWLYEKLYGEVFFQLNLDKHDRRLRALATYAISDRLNATVGVETFSGPDDSTFGSLESNRGIFAELRYGL